MIKQVYYIPIKPVPKQRPQFNSRTKTAYTPRRTLTYEKEIKSHINRSMREKKYKPIQDKDIPLKITLVFTFSIPKSWSKSKKELALSGQVYPIGSNLGDVDNLAKAVLDAMNKSVYQDDRQIIELNIKKNYGEQEGIIVILEGFDEG